MGCISSKAIGRSMSIREELNHGFQSTSVAAWEELLTSHSGNDQLFAFVRSSTNKRRTSSLALPPTDPQTPQYSFNVIADNDEKPEAKPTTEIAGELDFIRFTRSKSCQILREKETLNLATESDGLNENKLDWKDKSLAGSTSFHTVEEYDALLERIHKLTASNGSFDDCCSSPEVKSRQSNALDEHQMDGCNQRVTEDSLNQEDPSSLDKFKNVLQGGSASGCETGWKRKERAKELKNLDVLNIDFPRVKKWIQMEGEVYSPGTYVTPKFGSYNTKVTPAMEEKGSGEDNVFSPDLLAAFEDCMEQLQVEEDTILSHMDGHFLVEDEMENRV
ncbi:hypothetical protein BUALT_Bualt03G0096600 [Buddleja alternifolia]|uniref:Uncharacterized protein n=1 Tax=Buddleja alternifolia TaxID=168488 RepID=A0AAV6XZ61_9LAMI|nr:hypothetical protein BUALT_Bualt03G0096600 [Buddleja alternifolia]